jgi:argonaute-like protein implicated in RNA metabolism and viral defense
MGTIELKSDLHKILDRIENEQLLRTIYDFLKQRETAKEGQIWKTLTEEQKKKFIYPMKSLKTTKINRLGDC